MVSVCEGIETAAELTLLSTTGCEAGQGWLWSRALSTPELRRLLDERADGFAVAPGVTGTVRPVLPRTPLPTESATT